MTTISAKTVLRSRNAARPDKVLSTLLLRYPRWIHAEQRTHRLIPLAEDLGFDEPTPSLMADPNLSRNAASSRAIPISKLIDDVRNDPAIPIYWGKNQRGMQANEECDEKVYMLDSRIGRWRWMYREEAWLEARDQAIDHARAFEAAGYHKQIVNRLLEPFSHITVLVSATEWDNFLKLRDHPDAEPHIRKLAQEIRKCLEDESTIQTLQPGEWHLPFVTDEDRFMETTDAPVANGDEMVVDHFKKQRVRGIELIKLSVARCASTSYKTVDGFEMTLERARALHDKLMASDPIHASPAEHVARADDWEELIGWFNPEHHGNFIGFCQYRKQVEKSMFMHEEEAA